MPPKRKPFDAATKQGTGRQYLLDTFAHASGDDLLNQGRATFTEQGPNETFRSSSWAGVTNENPKIMMYILQLFYCKAGKSLRRLVLLAMKKYFNVRLDG